MVLQSVIFGLLAAFGWGVSDFLAAVVSRQLGVLKTAVGVHVASVAAATLLLPLLAGFGQVSAGQWAAMVGMALLGSVTYLGFYKALQLGPVAIVSPVVAGYAVVVIVLAFAFAGERLTVGQAAGASATIGGVVLVSVNPHGLRSSEAVLSKGVLFGLAAMLGAGVWQYLIGVMSKDLGWFTLIYVTRLLTLGLLAPVSALRGQWPWQGATVSLAIGLAVVGVVETGALFAFTRGTEVGLISIVAAASTGYPVIPILGGLLVLGERLALSQVAGLAVVLAGLLLLGLSA